MLLGIWRNVEDLEASLNLNELEAVVTAAKEREMRHNRFMAAIQGIDIDKDEKDSKQRFDEVQRRAAAKLSGRSEESLELDIFGLDIETEEE